jgi:uncharacterized protein (TIGR03083 family)
VPVTADDLDESLGTVIGTLRTEVGRDWRTAVGTGIWTARATAEHLGDTLISYAAQIVVQPDDRYVPMASDGRDGKPADLLDFVRAGAGILAATVRTAGDDVRAFHPSGMADPEGFAGMGCVELLVHGEDIARGLGLALDPPPAVCERVLARMFPEVAEETAGDAWDGLLWATGRIELPDHERRTSWRWRGAPLDDPDGEPPA